MVASSISAEQGNLKALQNSLEWSKGKLKGEEIDENVVIETAKHVAARRRKSELLDKLWEWATENRTTEELNNKLLLAKDLGNRPPGTCRQTRATQRYYRNCGSGLQRN